MRLLIIGLLLVFAVAVLSCGGGLMQGVSVMHGGMECSSMFTDKFIVSQKDLGAGLKLALLAAALFLLSAWAEVIAGRRLSGPNIAYRLRLARNGLRHHRDYIRQLLSRGILHPQIY